MQSNDNDIEISSSEEEASTPSTILDEKLEFVTNYRGERLILAGETLFGDDLIAYLEILITHPTITTVHCGLQVYLANLSDDQIEQICGLLSKNKSLWLLDLSLCELPDAAVQAFKSVSVEADYHLCTLWSHPADSYIAKYKEHGGRTLKITEHDMDFIRHNIPYFFKIITEHARVREVAFPPNFSLNTKEFASIQPYLAENKSLQLLDISRASLSIELRFELVKTCSKPARAPIALSMELQDFKPNVQTAILENINLICQLQEKSRNERKKQELAVDERADHLQKMLPNEVLIHIISFLDWPDFLTMQLVCKHLYNMCQEQTLPQRKKYSVRKTLQEVQYWKEQLSLHKDDCMIVRTTQARASRRTHSILGSKNTQLIEDIEFEFEIAEKTYTAEDMLEKDQDTKEEKVQSFKDLKAQLIRALNTSPNKNSDTPIRAAQVRISRLFGLDLIVPSHTPLPYGTSITNHFSLRRSQQKVEKSYPVIPHEIRKYLDDLKSSINTSNNAESSYIFLHLHQTFPFQDKRRTMTFDLVNNEVKFMTEVCLKIFQLAEEEGDVYAKMSTSFLENARNTFALPHEIVGELPKYALTLGDMELLADQGTIHESSKLAHLYLGIVRKSPLSSSVQFNAKKGLHYLKLSAEAPVVSREQNWDREKYTLLLMGELSLIDCHNSANYRKLHSHNNLPFHQNFPYDVNEGMKYRPSKVNKFSPYLTPIHKISHLIPLHEIKISGANTVRLSNLNKSSPNINFFHASCLLHGKYGAEKNYIKSAYLFAKGASDTLESQKKYQPAIHGNRNIEVYPYDEQQKEHDHKAHQFNLDHLRDALKAWGKAGDKKTCKKASKLLEKLNQDGVDSIVRKLRHLAQGTKRSFPTMTFSEKFNGI